MNGAARLTALATLLASCAPARTTVERPPLLSAKGAAHARAEAITPPVARTPPMPTAPRGVTSLAVPGYETATVSFPEHATLPEPVLIATHGAGDTPDALCRTWRDIAGDRGVILCPAGPRMRAHEDGRYFPDHPTLERIVFASLRALGAAYPGVVDSSRAIYAGYSQGATMGALMIVPHAAECPRLVLTEGGVADWSTERAAEFARLGGLRVLFACGRTKCETDADRAAKWLREAGLEAHVVASIGAGHTYRGAVAAKLHDAFDWLVTDDPRWAR